MDKKIRVALFMTMNTVMTKYSGILNLLEHMYYDDRFEVYVMPTHNVPDCVKSWLKTTKYSIINYSPSIVQAPFPNMYLDYVITIDPYYGPHCKGLGYRKWNVPIIYKEYGVTGIDGSKALYDKDIYRRAYMIITDTQEDLINIRVATGHNCVVVGNPLFDYPVYQLKEESAYILPERPTVIWSPHCSICDDTENKITGGRFSTFLTYKDAMIEAVKMFPQIDFVLKIHPYLTTRLDKAFKKGLIPKFSYEDWLSEITSYPNVKLMKTTDLYYPTFLKSSAMINDSISFVAEYLPTLRPMLVLTDEGRSKYSDYAEKLIEDCYYTAKDKYDLFDFLSGVVIGAGQGADKEPQLVFKRMEYLKRYKNTPEGIASTNSQAISDYIVAIHRKYVG